MFKKEGVVAIASNHHVPFLLEMCNVPRVVCAHTMNTITIHKYKDMYPERVDEKGVPDPQYIRKADKKLEAYGEKKDT